MLKCEFMLILLNSIILRKTLFQARSALKTKSLSVELGNVIHIGVARILKLRRVVIGRNFLISDSGSWIDG